MSAFSVSQQMLFVALILIYAIRGNEPRIRLRRETGGSQSLLTVEWEGIQTGDHPDDSVGGFAVEYRAEKDTQWHVHDGIIPYKGPNLQYRVQIPRLPAGIAYFVRIKVLGKNGKILVETPEIRARNEMVSIKCESDELTAPRNLEVTQTGQYSIAISWEPPECGSVGEYHIELAGTEAKFDVHRQTVTHPSVSVTNLLPGTEYQVRVRAADRLRTLGPWNDFMLVAKTEGEAPKESDEIELDYRTDSELRISWQPYEDERLQHYEVMAVEVDGESQAVERARVSPLASSHIFVRLKPDTQYDVGVVAFVDHEPKLVYKLLAKTAPTPGVAWEDKPVVAPENEQQFLVQWRKPSLSGQTISKFVIEYRLPNETEWRKYDDLIVDDETNDYHIQFDGIYDGSLYSFRILAVDDQLKIAAKTAEITVGSVASDSCVGDAGIPQNIRASVLSEATIQFMWEKPRCDESYGPIDGYEYTFWNAETDAQPETASYVGRNTVSLNDLSPATRYAFRVRSRAGHGHSPWSEIVNAETEEHSGPKVSISNGDIYRYHYQSPLITNNTLLFYPALQETPTPALRRLKRQQKNQITDYHNIYQLRIILAPPKSYLAWTPLPEHADEVTKFKLSYKKSAGDQWTRIIESPEYFKCPEGIADPEDFCYDLSKLSFGVQYTADLVYELENSEWTTHGSPLFFILVEAGIICAFLQSSLDLVYIVLLYVTAACISFFKSMHAVVCALFLFLFVNKKCNLVLKSILDKCTLGTWEPSVPTSPHNLQIRPHDASSIELHWLPPLNSKHIPFYQAPFSFLLSPDRTIAIEDLHTRRVRTEQVPGSFFSYLLSQLSPHTIYNISVRAGTDHGELGLPISKVFSLRHHKDTEIPVFSSPARTKEKISEQQVEEIKDDDERAKMELHRKQMEEENRRNRIKECERKRLQMELDRLSKERERNRVLHEQERQDQLQRQLERQRWEMEQRQQWQREREQWEERERERNRQLVEYQRHQKQERQHQREEVPERIRQQLDQVRVLPERDEERGAMPKPLLGIDKPRIEQRGTRTLLYWTVGGDTSNVVAYQIDLRSESDHDWRNFNGYVPHSPSEIHFRQELTNLETNKHYYVKVSAIDQSRRILAVSEATIPSNAPQDLRLESVAEGIQLIWSWADQEECDPYFLITGYRDGIPFSKRANGGERQFIFQNAEAGEWHVEIRAGNRAGTGPSSAPVNLQSSSKVSKGIRVLRSICDPRVDFWCRSPDESYDIAISRHPNEGLIACAVPTGQSRHDIVLIYITLMIIDAVHAGYFHISTSRVKVLVQVSEFISEPSVSARDGDLYVEWISEGTGHGVFGYRVQYRTENTGWTSYGQIVPYVGDGKHYKQQLTGLQQGSVYYIHIQVLDRNSYVMYTSPEVSGRTICSAPTHPPSHLQVQAADSRHIRVSWAQPPQNTWQCSDIQVELGIKEPPGIAPILLNGYQTSHVLDSEANQQWSIRIRTKNSAGASPWSQIASVRTPPVGELIIGPVVSYRHGIPVLTWSGKERVDDLIQNYQIEYRTSVDAAWQRLRAQVPYMGWQRPYSIDLSELPAGRSYQIRIHAVDANNGIAYTSSAVNVQTQTKCSAPRRTPLDLQATSLGPTQIRVSWKALHESEWNCNRLWYIVKYSTPHNQGFKNLTLGENHVIFDSEPFTRWTFEIQAANPSGETQWSRPVTVQTEGTAPGPVSDLRIYPESSDALQLAWRQPQTPNGQITGYEVTYQLLSKGMCDQVEDRPVTVTSDRTSFTLRNLLPHSKYRISVAAKTNIAGQQISQEVQTEEAAPSGAPVYIRATNIQPTEVSIVWQAPACLQTNGEITEYEFEATPAERYDSGGTIKQTVRGTRTKITGLSSYTKYLVRIRAFTRKGPGPWSEPIQFQTAATPDIPAPPMVRVLSTGLDNADLVWQEPYPSSGLIDRYKCKYAVAGTKQYQERQFPSYNPCDQEVIRMRQLSPPPTGSKLHCGRIDGLEPEKKYTFMISAGDRSGTWSPWSEPQVGHISEGPVQVISLNKLGGTATNILIGWNVRPTDTARVVGYRIHVTPVVQYGAKPITFTVDRATLQYNIDSLSPNTRYNITVDATTDGVHYHPGTAIEVRTDSGPANGLMVTPRVIEEQATSVTLEWNAPHGDVSGFVIEYRLEGGVWQQYNRRVPAHPGRRLYTAQIDQLPTNSVVDLRVRVVSPQNEQSAPSQEVRARTRCSAPPSPPQAIRLDAPSTSEVRVSWAQPAKDTWQCDQLNYDLAYRVAGQPERVVPVPGDQTDYTFPSEANTRWAVKLRCTNQVGSSPWSSEQVITTRQGIPGPVRDLRLRAKSPNEVHVQWLAPLVQRGTIVGYDISYRLKHRLACPDEEPRDVSRDFVTVYNHKDLEYTLTGLLPFSLYEVRVRARTTELGPEESKEIATDQQPPSAPPLNLQLSYTLERSISFQWEPVECSQRHGHIVNYEYEIQGQDDWAKLERQIANTTNTKINIEGLTPFTKYIMRVKAYNSIGGGPNTENLDAMTARADAPLPPQDLVVAQEGTDYFMISWLPPYPPYGPHDKYKIRYQLLSESRWMEIEKNTKDRLLQCPAESPRHCLNVTNLESGRQYRVQVAAHIEGGSYGPWSTVTIANTLQILPDAPRAIELVQKTDHSLHIRWIPPPDPLGQITQYKVGIVSLDDPYDKLKTFLIDHPTLEYLLNNLHPETSYNISISAGTKRGFGPLSWTRYSTDPFKVPPVASAPQVTADGADALNVQWNGILDTKNQVRGYIIEFRSSDNPTFTEYDGIIEHDISRRNYQQRLSLLDADTLYFVRIKVVDRKQRVSEPSPEGSARTGCAVPLAPPSNVNAFAPSPYQVHISWQPPSQSSWQCSNIKYKLEYTNGSSSRREIDIPSSVTDHVLDASPNTLWRIRIRVENEAGASDWSKEVSITTAEGAPSAVEDLDAHPSGPEAASIIWRPPSQPNGQITGYTLVYRLKSRGECGPRSAQPITINTQEEESTVEGLLPDSTYEVHVTAHTSQPGPQSNIITVTTDEAVPTGAPLNPRVSSVTQTRSDFLWNEPDCELRNGKIMSYEWQIESLDPWGESKTGQSSAQRVSFDDLVPYTQYKVRVLAENSVGQGPWSEWITFRTQPAAPPPPTDLSEEQSFPHAIEISFLPPSPPHGIINEYRIRHTPSGQLNYKEVRVVASRLHCSDASKRDRLCYRVVDLEPEQEYEIQTSAHTEGGAWSDWSESMNARTHEQNIPVLERELEVVDSKPNSITVRWQGLDADQSKHVVGYVLEYKSEDDDWKEYDGIVKHRGRQNDYRIQIKSLEPSTEYFFRLKVVGKNDKRGSSGPELKAMTKCGRPEEPPTDLQLSSDFENVKLTWTNPEEESWKCNNVEYVIDFVNTTSRGIMTVPTNAPTKLLLPSLPGTKWEIRMRTQTIEEGQKPSYSPWSDRVTLVTQALPGELFLTVEPKTATSAVVIWDLADQDKKWNYGVDISYRLKQLGGCAESRSGAHEPVTNYNVQDKQVVLHDLTPGSEYEVTVTPRRPPTLRSSVPTPKTVRRFRTKANSPSGPPSNLRSEGRRDTEISFKWEPPVCEQQNGKITQYEYEVTGVEEWNDVKREGVTPRTNAAVDQVKPGSTYNVRVRAYTSEGPGPWSEPIQITTTGTELGPPRELSAVHTKPKSIQLTWLPPYPERAPVVVYKIRYSPRADDSNPVEMELSSDQLSCTGYKSRLITSDNLCATVRSLQPDTTYRFAVQAQSPTGNWGEWSPAYFATTRSTEDGPIPGKLRLVSAGHDNLRVNWTAPTALRNVVDQYLVSISLASSLDKHPKQFTVRGEQNDYHFHDLEPITHYNITIQGLSEGKRMWFITEVFSTTDYGSGLLSWLSPPTDLKLLEKSDRMMHVAWSPPEIFDMAYKDLITHYRVTIAPFNVYTGKTDRPRNYSVPYPGTSIKFDNLSPETIYNITVQAGTNSGYGEVLWGTYSTLAPGQNHVLRLLDRTPTSLTVEWEPTFLGDRGYTLSWESLHSVFDHVRPNVIRSAEVLAGTTQYTIDNLEPSTVYNVTLQPRPGGKAASGAYATLPPGWFMVRNLVWCDRTNYALSMTWEPVNLNKATHYQVRYLRLKEHDAIWTEEGEVRAVELLCPKDGCNRHCYLVFNLIHNPNEYVFQVRAKVNNQWNRWKTAGKPSVFEKSDRKKACCIVPPPYMVENIGVAGTLWEVDIAPVESQPQNISRYYVVVDEREPAGSTNWTELTDKVTANRMKIPYYVAASFNADTLPGPRKVRIGDGTVLGGYLNYPLVKGKKYNYEIYSVWELNGKPAAVARQRG
uniref:Fibronectin type-III domain-containing protein n=1 Tax=Setaria digitata TaxID=48799 RepID=A0A915Q6K3_9BILA